MFGNIWLIIIIGHDLGNTRIYIYIYVCEKLKNLCANFYIIKVWIEKQGEKKSFVNH